MLRISVQTELRVTLAFLLLNLTAIYNAYTEVLSVTF